MNWKLLVGLFVGPFLIVTFLTLIGDQIENPANASAASVQDYARFVDAAGNVYEIQVDNPTGGSGQNPITTTISYPQSPFGWISFLARASSMQGSFFEPWTAPIRAVFGVFTFPALLMFTIALYAALSFFVGGIFGRTTP